MFHVSVKSRYLLALGLCFAASVVHTSAAELPKYVFATSNVTDYKYKVPIEKSNNKVTVITREELEASGITSLSTALQGITGLSTASAGSTTGLFLRGLASNQTKVMIDGISLADPSTPQNTPYFDAFVFDQIEKIEVVEGAKSTLYGSDALGGVVNILTKKTGDKVDVRFGDSKYSASWVSNPKVGDTNFHIGIGRQSDSSLSALKIGSELDKSEQTQYRFGVDQKLGNATVEASYIKSKAYFDLDSDYTLTGTPNALDDPNYINLVDQDLMQTKITLPLTPNFINTISYKTYYISREAHNGVDANHGTYFSNTLNRARSDEFEISYSNKISSEWDASWGASFYKETMDLSGEGINEYGANSYTNAPVEQKRNGFFMQHDFHWDRTSVLAGIRQDEYTTSKNTKQAFTYSVGGRYLVPGIETTFKANMNTGFRNPGLYEKTFATTTKPIQAESSFTKDLTLEKKIGNILLSATVFESLVNNKIEYSDLTLGYDNTATQNRTTGIHYQAQFEQLGVLDFLKIGYLNQKSRNSAGTDTIRIPEQTITCFGGKQFGPLSLGFSVIYNTGRMDTVKGTLVYLSSYTLVNSRIGYQFSTNTTGYILIQNILNTSYEEVAGYSTAARNVQIGMQIDL